MPQNLAEHLKRRRLELSLLQRQVAAQIGVGTEAVRDWELGLTQPTLRNIPALVAFLGYSPFPPGETLGEQLALARRLRGMKREPLARLLGTNRNILLDWEKGRRLPEGQDLERVRKFIAETPMEGREERKEEESLPNDHHSNGGPKRPEGKEGRGGNDDMKEINNR